MGLCLTFNTKDTEKVSLGSQVAKRLPERRVCIFLFWLAGKWSLWYSCHWASMCLSVSRAFALTLVCIWPCNLVVSRYVSSATLGVSHPRLGLIPRLCGLPTPSFV